jgi:hypothetical protein
VSVVKPPVLKVGELFPPPSIAERINELTRIPITTIRVQLDKKFKDPYQAERATDTVAGKDSDTLSFGVVQARAGKGN